MKFVQKHLALFIALALPVLLLVGIVLVVYLPRLMAELPRHQLVYTDGAHDICLQSLEVVDGQVSALPIGQGRSEYCQEREVKLPAVYIYNPATKTHRSVSLTELRGATVSNDSLAPDGYRLARDRGHDGIFEIFGDSGLDWYLVRNSARWPVRFEHLPRYPEPEFVGWITEGLEE